MTGTKLAVVAIVRACYQAKAWAALNENVLLISKRRSQLKQARAVRSAALINLSPHELLARRAGHHLHGARMHDLPGRHAGPGL